MMLLRLLGAAACALALVASAAAAETARKAIRLYVLDCGDPWESQDLAMMSDTGHYDGKPGKMAVPCFLVRHPKGWLLWDTGMENRFASLKSQLEGLGVAPGDVTYVAFSHLHFDHAGNAGRFLGATWLLQRSELAYALSAPPPFSVSHKAIAGHKQAKMALLDGDHDVFGDATVRLLRTPGHTPGHQSLAVSLPESGLVIVSGDLWHLRESRRARQVPAANSSRAETLASFDRVEEILKRTGGRLIIQHDYEDYEALPKPPAHLK